MYYTTLWRIHVTTAVTETHQYVSYVVELHVTVNNTKMLSAKQKFFLPNLFRPQQ